jgi:ricin-type beta-trefoil lectin protein/Leucine Rich Repeat (LRR) protein
MVDAGRERTRRGARDGDEIRPDTEREAQSRIEREATARSGRLSLAGLGLRALPPGALELSGLRELDLSGNRLEQLPERISQLTALERLVLRGNRLAGLPPSLTALVRLKHLDLSENQFAEIPRWLGRLDLESIQLGDATDLVHPPAEVAAQGTQAVLAFLRERDGVRAAQIDGGALTRRARPASAEMPVVSGDPIEVPALSPAEPTRAAWRSWLKQPRVLMLGAGVLLVLAVTPFVLPHLGGAAQPRSSGVLGNQNGSAGGAHRASHPGATVLIPMTPSGAAGAPGTRPSASAGQPAVSQGAAASSAASPSAAWSADFMPTPVSSMPMAGAPLTGLVLSGNAGGGALCAVAVAHGPNAGEIDVSVCDSAAASAWTFEPGGDTFQTSGLCMAVLDDAASAAPRVVLNICDAGPEQVFVPQNGGRLYNPGSGLCVSEVSGKKHQQAAVSMELCGAAGQQWNLPT